MKKILLSIMALIATLLLVACGTGSEDANTLKTVLDLMEVEYTSGDTSERVTRNVTLENVVSDYEDVSIKWTSNSSVIDIEGKTGIVTRAQSDQAVRLTVTVSLGSLSDHKQFDVIVLKIDPNEDITNPVISGTKNWNIKLGSAKPNWLDGVTATDNVDGHVTVNVDDRAVDVTKLGTYDLVYTATDNSHNTATVIVKVIVSETGEDRLTLTYKFEFPSSDLNHGYSESSLTGQLTNSVDGSKFTVGKKRANTAQGGEGLVISGASSSEHEAWVSFEFSQAVSKITFDARYWGSFDAEAATVVKFQKLNGSQWVDVDDLKVSLGGVVEFKNYAFDVDGTTFRFYVDASVSDRNTARLVINNMHVYESDGGNQSGPDTTKLVISGTKNWNIKLGSTKPNWLDGVTATDNADGNVTVSVNDSAVNLNAVGTYNLIYTATDNSNNITTITVQVKVSNEVVLDGYEHTFESPFGKNLNQVYTMDNDGVASYKFLSGLIDEAGQIKVDNTSRGIALGSGKGSASMELNFIGVTNIEFDIARWGNDAHPDHIEVIIDGTSTTYDNYVDFNHALKDLSNKDVKIIITGGPSNPDTGLVSRAVLYGVTYTI